MGYNGNLVSVVSGRDMAAAVRLLVKQARCTVTVKTPYHREVKDEDGALCYSARKGARGWLVRCVQTARVQWQREPSPTGEQRQDADLNAGPERESV